ncbi:MAG TPA: hypothetical protein VN688_28385 [Gemmataceae bacterium]|nr:hypothetical protein [Gemmataceae bacterium]
MKFLNPWIDPRILQVRPESVRTYLLAKGWEYLGPALMPDMLMFDTPEPRGDKPNVLLPLKLDHGAYIQRLIDLISDVALYEDRWAVDVLGDMLRQPAEPVSANGPSVSLPAEPVSK